MFIPAEKRYNDLPYRRVGKTGLRLPLISLGLWQRFDSSAAYYDRKKVILSAFNRGVFSFDCADHYGTPEIGTAEKLLGDILQDELKPYRDELVITTKVGYRTIPGPYGHFLSRKTIMQSIDQSLQRLKTDYVDIYYAHRFDPQTDLAETATALDNVVRQGKALYIGISNFDVQQTKAISQLFKKMGTPFTVNQVSYNMLNQDVEKSGLLAAMKQEEKGLVAYGPLAEGLLSERYLKEISVTFKIHHTSQAVFAAGKEQVLYKLRKLNELAQERKQTLSQMALAWLLRDETVASVIIGTTSLDHLTTDLAAADNLSFSAAELQRINDIVTG
ncbi:aldo/keto reductase [Liquorilactobacillus capillatus]|uniref:Aryl-alcohol dehydrogenase-like protein n=1 Tax=Liquorilactobacillus capillatus DSM 19910 TaxID=1423731 RepID=A0A0R1LYI0_9LACO|nr:aldo/keto reductase [Liquorilactobacillus capillatus]KRL00624.1 aryl-alcohol dehydrogenase-like protein [Liquorilactobacillus capillatus DSM 19910]